MTPGIYRVEFKSLQGSIGTGGLAVVDGGRIHGGDLNFIYRGTYTSNGQNITATVDVSNDTGRSVSIFGAIQNFTLELSGQANANGFALTGGVRGKPQMQISVNGQKKADLVS